ncbi:hypothetical protein L7F22_025615 [Adiantum nelumboides]|nr:hypothetical protein [Adiantum nelumboides]
MADQPRPRSRPGSPSGRREITRSSRRADRARPPYRRAPFLPDGGLELRVRPALLSRAARGRRAHPGNRRLRRLGVLPHRARAQPHRRRRRPQRRPADPFGAAGARRPVVPAVGLPARHHRHHPGHRLHRRTRRRRADPAGAGGRRAAGRDRLGYRHRAVAGHRDGAVDGVRRAGPEEPRDRPPDGGGALGGVAAGRVRLGVPLAHRRAEHLGQRHRAPPRRRAGRGAALGPLPRRAELAGPGQRRERQHRPGHRGAAGPLAALHRPRRRGPDDPARAGGDHRRHRHRDRPGGAGPPVRVLPVPGRGRRPGRPAGAGARQAGVLGPAGPPRRHRRAGPGPAGRDRAVVAGR